MSLLRRELKQFILQLDRGISQCDLEEKDLREKLKNCESAREEYEKERVAAIKMLGSLPSEEPEATVPVDLDSIKAK